MFTCSLTTTSVADLVRPDQSGSRKSEDLRRVVGDEDGVFELGGPVFVLGGDGPAVVPDVVGDAAEGDHRLDGEGHAGLDEGVHGWVVVVQDDQSTVE